MPAGARGVLLAGRRKKIAGRLRGRIPQIMETTAHIRFSVIIPAWNAAQTIVQAIRSCTEQSYPPHEIIVVDDASTDDTSKLVASFPQVTCIRLEQNSGPAHARNTGWDVATGD